MNFTYALVNTTINCHLCYICYLRLCFLHCLLAVITRTLNLNHLRGRRTYRLRNKKRRTTANLNELDQQRRRKLYDLVPEIRTIPCGVRKTTKSDHVKCVLFLHVAGEKAVEVYNALTFTEAERSNYNALVRKFKKSVEGKKRFSSRTLCL